MFALGSRLIDGQWKGRGAITAFLIALYAEMWGFPLSLFVITTMLGGEHLPYQFDSLAYLLTKTPSAGDPPFYNPPLAFRAEYIAARAVTLLAMLPVIGGWYTLTRKTNGGPMTSGPYAICRHPQYVGFIMFIIGMTMYWPSMLTIPMGAVMCFAYQALAGKEERAMLAGPLASAYRDYAAKVPRFPAWRELPKLFRLPDKMTVRQKTAAAAILLPFTLWLGEAVLAWGFGYEQAVREYWFPIAYALPVHIGLVASAVLLGLTAAAGKVDKIWHGGSRLSPTHVHGRVHRKRVDGEDSR